MWHLLDMEPFNNFHKTTIGKCCFFYLFFIPDMFTSLVWKKRLTHWGGVTHISGLSPDILKMESWTNMRLAANIIIKDIIHIFASICKSCIFCWWDDVIASTDICISKLTIIGPDNGLSPNRRQAIIWTSAGILLIRTLGTNFSEILSEILTFSFMKMHLKMLSGRWWQFCLCLNVLTNWHP